MDAVTLSFLGLFVGTGLLMVLLSVPLMQRRVKPNRLYGFRTRKTLGDERVWYDANAYMGRALFRVGTAYIVAVVAIYFVLRPDFVAFNTACGLTLAGLLSVAVGLSFRYLRSL